jgi:hypothetical protein
MAFGVFFFVFLLKCLGCIVAELGKGRLLLILVVIHQTAKVVC